MDKLMTYDILLTIVPMVALLVAVLWKSSSNDGSFSFDKNFTGVLKGVSAIIVVFVHVPEAYHNPGQRLIMCFGFVAVTVFFMISAYGMLFSVNKNEEKYLSHFWRNRLASLLIPCLLIHLVGIVFKTIQGRDFSVIHYLISLPGYVWVLLQYCLLFFVVMLCRQKFRLSFRLCHVLMVLAITGSSLYLYLSSPDAENSSQMGWCYERMGLVWGTLLFVFFPRVANFMRQRWVAKTAVLGLLSLALGVAYVLNKHIWFYGEYLLKIVLGFVIISFVLFLAKKRTFGNAVINHLGLISYEIYLSHELVMSIVASYFPSISSGLFVCATLAFTILLSSFVHVLSAKMVSFVRA
ncbi:MAG: acyltransferase [Fibrobacter sp.]|nr:acyltransferase [Fibrobacter sp.]